VPTDYALTTHFQPSTTGIACNYCNRSLLFATDATGIRSSFNYKGRRRFARFVQRFHKPGVTGSSPVSAIDQIYRNLRPETSKTFATSWVCIPVLKSILYRMTRTSRQRKPLLIEQPKSKSPARRFPLFGKSVVVIGGRHSHLGPQTQTSSLRTTVSPFAPRKWRFL